MLSKKICKWIREAHQLFWPLRRASSHYSKIRIALTFPRVKMLTTKTRSTWQLFFQILLCLSQQMAVLRTKKSFENSSLETKTWNSELHSRPSQECLPDYKDDTIADVFPLLFPFGYTGLREDPVVLSLQEKTKHAYHELDRMCCGSISSIGSMHFTVQCSTWL